MPYSVMAQFPKCKFCGEVHRIGPQWCSALMPSVGTGGLRIKVLPRKEVGPVGDGVMLTSKESPPGLTEKVAEAIRDGKLSFKRGRPLAKDADKSLARLKPWEKEGISRRTWYRRRREGK
jgi:hypothetical protein